MVTASDHQLELYGRILWDCKEFVRKLLDYKALNSIESAPRSSEKPDYILLGGWEFNVHSIIDTNANVNDVLVGFHLLNEHAPNMFERLYIIFFLKALHQFRNFKPSKLISNPCFLEPEMADLLRLCYWYCKCWELNNDNFSQFKSGEIKEKLGKGLISNIEEYRIQIKDDFHGSSEDEFIAWLKEELGKTTPAKAVDYHFSNFVRKLSENIRSVNSELMLAALSNSNDLITFFDANPGKDHDFDFLVNNIPIQVKTLNSQESAQRSTQEIEELHRKEPSTLEEIKSNIVNYLTSLGGLDLMAGPPGPEGPKGESGGPSPITTSFILWRDDTTGSAEIMLRRSVVFDLEEKNLSNNPGNSFDSSIAVSDNNVHVVWNDDTPGNYEIFYSRSTDGGDTFSSTINLSNNVDSSLGPAVAVSSNNVYVVWQDGVNAEIFYRRSTDGGISFGPIENLSNNEGASWDAAITVFSNNVYTIWADTTTGSFDIFYRKSTDGGISFGPIENLSNNLGTSFLPSIAVNNNNVYVVWLDSSPGNSEIFYRRSTNSGVTFGPIENLSNSPGNTDLPSIALSGNNVYVVWSDTNNENYDVFYRRSSDGGTVFGSAENLSNNIGDSFASFQAITVSGGIVYVVWSDFTTGNFEVLYRRSTEDSNSFGPTENLSKDFGNSYESRVTSSSIS